MVYAKIVIPIFTVLLCFSLETILAIVRPPIELKSSGKINFNFKSDKLNGNKTRPTYPSWGAEYILPNKKDTLKLKPKEAKEDLDTANYPQWGAEYILPNKQDSLKLKSKEAKKDLDTANAHLDISALFGVFDKPSIEVKDVERKVMHGNNHLEGIPNQEYNAIDNFVTDINNGHYNNGQSSYSTLGTDYDYDINGAPHHAQKDNHNQNKQVHNVHDVDYNPYHPKPLVTVTETRHLTSYVTKSILSTSYNYVTQYATQFVPTHVPTYVTNYVTSFATAYVTQKFPIYETKYVTEYHTQIHTITDTYTDLYTTTQIEYNTNYITETESLLITTTEIDYVTDYITKTDYVTSTLYLTTTKAYQTTHTAYRDVPYPIATTLYDSIYVTQTLSTSYVVTSTVWQPQYITKFVTVTGSEYLYTPTLNNYHTNTLTYAPIYYHSADPSHYYSHYY